MTERQRLLFPPAVSSSVESTRACSSRLCLPQKLSFFPVSASSEGRLCPMLTYRPCFARPDARAAKSISSAGSRLSGLRLSAQVILKARRLPFCTRMAKRQNLSAPHAPPAVILSEGTCSSIPCLPPALSFRTTPLLSKGVWGPKPPCFRRPCGLPLPPAKGAGHAKTHPANIVFAQFYYTP